MGRTRYGKSGNVAFCEGNCGTPSERLGLSDVQRSVVRKKSNQKWVNWGHHNKLPYEILKLITGNGISLQLLQTKIDLTVGERLIIYKDVISEGKESRKLIVNDVIQDFIDDNDGYEVSMDVIMDLLILGNAFVKCIMDRNNPRKVTELIHIDAYQCRLGEIQPSGFVETVYECADWEKATHNKKEGDAGYIRETPLYSQRWNEDEIPDAFIFHLKRKLPGQPYYGVPDWIGNWDWMELARKVPKWQNSNISRSMNIKYIVRIPENYFTETKPDNLTAEAYEDEVLDAMDEMLTGEENVSKTFYTKYGDITKDWKIELVSNDVKDEAFLKVYEASNAATLSGQGINPSLSGIQSAGSLSSGSDIRNSYLFFILAKTPRVRHITLKPWRYVAKRNGWSSKIGFKNFEITTLDANPTGSQSAG